MIIAFRHSKPGLNRNGPTEMFVLAIVLGSFLMFIVYQLASSLVVPESNQPKERVASLEKDLASLSERYKNLQAQLTIIEREAKVFRSANRLLRTAENQNQAERNRMQSELDFYRRLAGTSGRQTGLAVYAAELTATDSDRVFRFILTLTQNIRRASVVSGRVRINVEGTLGDQPVTLNWAQVSDGSAPDPPFRFKYFQQVDGYLAIPQDFSPTRLRVMLEVEGQRKPVVHVFDWSELVAGPWENQGQATE